MTRISESAKLARAFWPKYSCCTACESSSAEGALPVKHLSGSADPSVASTICATSVTAWLRAGGRRRAWLARALFILVFTLLFASAGCEVLTYERTDFPEAFAGANGQAIFWDAILEKLTDGTLNEDDKRDALRDLGIEDEDVLDALIAIPPDQLD